MTIDFDLIIESGENPVDMKAGLTSMQGVSEIIRCVSESILTENVPERQNHKSSVRTSLKKSFKGSYGHTFSLDIEDPDLIEKITSIGRGVFVEVLAYFINESLYRDTNVSDNAKKVIERLDKISEKILSQLRQSPLKNTHDITEKFNYDVKIRYDYNFENKTIAYFDRSSAQILHAKKSREQRIIKATITRLNILTGNGRLQVEGEFETTAFGFDASYKDIRQKVRMMFSENMSKNNGQDSSRWVYMRMVAQPLELSDGRVVKYIIKSVYED